MQKLSNKSLNSVEDYEEVSAQQNILPNHQLNRSPRVYAMDIPSPNDVPDGGGAYQSLD